MVTHAIISIWRDILKEAQEKGKQVTVQTNPVATSGHVKTVTDHFVKIDNGRDVYFVALDAISIVTVST